MFLSLFIFGFFMVEGLQSPENENSGKFSPRWLYQRIRIRSWSTTANQRAILNVFMKTFDRENWFDCRFFRKRIRIFEKGQPNCR